MKGTTMSEASRRDANNGKDQHSIKDAIQQLDQEQTARSTRKLQLEIEIMSLNGRFEDGKRFGGAEYQRILGRQHDIKVALKEIELANREAKLRRKALQEDLISGSEDHIYKTAGNDLLKCILDELKAIRRLLTPEKKAEEPPEEQS